MIGYAPTVASSLANVVRDAVDAGAAAGTLAVYAGDRPDTTADTPTGTLLATFTLTDPSASDATDGLANWDFTTPPSATIAATGNPSWFRVADSDGNVVMDGDVGTMGADLNFASLVWIAGETVELTAGTTTAG